MSTDKLPPRRPIWHIGQALCVIIGLATVYEHGAAIGAAVTYALLILVDIRDEVTK